MDKVKVFTEQAKVLIVANPVVSGLVAIIIILILVLIFKRDSFDGMVEGVKTFAEYPSVFADIVLPDFVKDVVYDNYFTKAIETVMPNSVPMSQLELPTHTVSVPIDIGNGLAVTANVQVPSQITQVPSQVPVTLPEPTKSDIVVSAQQVQIPAQSGIIPGKIEGSTQILSVPVDIPAQVVSIPEQNAVIPTMEPFRM